jgi:hypothetical protein
MDVRRIDRPQSWEELLTIVNEVRCRSECLQDTRAGQADWAEALCVAYVCQKYKQKLHREFRATARATRFSARSSAGCLPLSMPSSRPARSGHHGHAKMRKFGSPDEQEPTTGGK